MLFQFQVPADYGLVNERPRTTELPLEEQLPFPLIPTSKPMVVRLVGGMQSTAIGPAFRFRQNGNVGGLSSWNWSAYAYSPLGWSCWSNVFFKGQTIDSIELGGLGDSQSENFEKMLSALRKELGEPNDTRRAARGIWPFRGAERTNQRASWRFPWGTVSVEFETRTWTAVTVVRWTAKPS